MVFSKDSQGCVVCWHHHLPISTAVTCIDKGGWVFHQNYVTLLSWWRHPSNQLACSYWLSPGSCSYRERGNRMCWQWEATIVLHPPRCLSVASCKPLFFHLLNDAWTHPEASHPQTECWAEWILIATSRKYIFVLNKHMIIVGTKRNPKTRNHQSTILNLIQSSSTGPQVTWNSKARFYCPRNKMSAFEPEPLLY